MKGAFLFVVCAACSSSNSGTSDAAIDAPPPHADALPDSPPGTGDHHRYVIDTVTVPMDSTQAKNLGLDLDGNGTADNGFGGALAFLAGQGFNAQAQITTAVDQGKMIMLTDVQATDLTAATNAQLALYQGSNPMPPACSGPTDTACRHHLQGNATFDVMPSLDPPLVGAIAAGTYTGGPGHLTLSLPLGGGPPLLLTLLGARAKLMPAPTTITSGIFGGGISQDDINNKVIPALQSQLAPMIVRDCCGPGNATHPSCAGAPSSDPCYCTSGSTGKTVISLLDADMDCTVTVSEIQSNGLVQLLLKPDVTLEGQKCLSLGVGFTAVPGMFTP